MKLEERTIITQDELARFLVDSAKKVLTENKILLGDLNIILPETFEIKLEYKEKRERVKFEMELIWDTGSTVERLRDNVTGPSRQPVASPESLKEIKKMLEKKFFEIKEALKNNRPPSKNNVDHFLRLIEAFREKAKSAWIPSIDELLNCAISLAEKVKTNNLEEAGVKIAEIENLKAKYHSLFK